MTSEIPPFGAFAVDTRSGRVGRVMGAEGPYVQLRPLAGGKEWDVPPEHLRVALVMEELSARVAELNRQSRMP
ncbi:MAG: hypothetical protein ACRDP3_04555 [Streptomyces sp.]|uniref:hypothetical protein n=1 Tax=Streptomyces sp. TaxID=1931 RepID=UPI003D6A1397